MSPATEGQIRATYRGGGGGGEERQDASTGNDDVVHHLGDEVDGVVDEDDVLIAVHKIHHGLGGVAERKGVALMLHKNRNTFILLSFLKFI